MGKRKIQQADRKHNIQEQLQIAERFPLGCEWKLYYQRIPEQYLLADDMFDMNASLSKSFMKEKLTLQLQAYNMLNPKQVAMVYSGIRVLQNIQTTHRQVSLTVRYKFNTTRSKYKGTGAGESQKNRM